MDWFDLAQNRYTDGVMEFSFDINPSDRTMALG
jgi:hypothetical protein